MPSVVYAHARIWKFAVSQHAGGAASRGEKPSPTRLHTGTPRKMPAKLAGARRTGREDALPYPIVHGYLKEDWFDMMIEIDFNSEEALYLQLRNQIILGIATSRIREGDGLPSVRQLAEDIGINMHTVNKAYTVLKQEGFVKVDRRRGAVVAIDADRLDAVVELRRELKVILAKGICRNISREEVHALIDEIYEDYGGLN